jgi:hypothetical protein
MEGIAMDQALLEKHPITPEKLSELAQLLTSCWEEVETRQLVNPENEASLRRTIASRIISAWEQGIEDVEELRGQALQGIVLMTPKREAEPKPAQTQPRGLHQPQQRR